MTAPESGSEAVAEAGAGTGTGTGTGTEPASAPAAPIPAPIQVPPTATVTAAWPPLPPRERWIAPGRRKAAIAIGAGGAALFFGLGTLTGALIGDHHDSRHSPMNGRDGFNQFQRGNIGPDGGQFGQQYGGPQFGAPQFGGRDGRQFMPGPQPSAKPQPSTSG